MYLVGASVAVLLVEVIERRLWAVLPVGGASLYFAYQVYVDYVTRLEEEHHRREIIDFLEQGMSVVDADGHVTYWNDALERMVGCSRERALRQKLLEAVPALRGTDVPRAIEATLKHRTSRTVADVRVGSGADARLLQVNGLPFERSAIRPHAPRGSATGRTPGSASSRPRPSDSMRLSLRPPAASATWSSVWLPSSP